ncbi:MAG: hypothetical protein L6V93_01260 [Clostridiales bacterium]|nr:MAG: hypothetical protein L6V93_01260 [Clostridiales bacterium]
MTYECIQSIGENVKNRKTEVNGLRETYPYKNGEQIFGGVRRCLTKKS